MRHKTYNTGKLTVMYAGVTGHAMADRDALAALGQLLAFEAHHGLKLLQQIRSAKQSGSTSRCFSQAQMWRISNKTNLFKPAM